MGQAKNRAAEIAKLKEQQVDLVPHINQLCDIAQKLADSHGWKVGYDANGHKPAVNAINELVYALKAMIARKDLAAGLNCFAANKDFLERELCAKYGTKFEDLYKPNYKDYIAKWSDEDKKRLGVMDIVIGAYKMNRLPSGGVMVDMSWMTESQKKDSIAGMQIAEQA